MPFAYVAVAVVLWLGALVAWFMAFRYFRGRSNDLSAKDKVIGFMLAGPFFPALHSSLGPRGYRFSTREAIGLLVIGAVVLAIIVGSLVHAYAGT
jgi:hypothetical protein